METQLKTSPWQALYHKAYPPEIVSKLTVKTDLPESSSKAGGIKPWVVMVGAVVILGVIVYINLQQKNDSKTGSQSNINKANVPQSHI